MTAAMPYVPLGRTGVQVSVFALGAMTFGAKNTRKIGGLSQDETNRMVARAIDTGVNLFDTADVYDEGESEKALGRALGSWREQILIATKVRGRTGPGMNEVGLSRHHIRQAIRGSVGRLGTPWVDIYQFHSWDPLTPLDESLETMQDLVEEGLVNYPGVSNFAAWQMATLQTRCEERGYARYEVAQMNYSLLNRDIEHEVLPFLAFSGMSLLVWSPLQGGILSGKYAKDTPPPSGTRMGNRGLSFRFVDEAKAWEVVEKVRTIGREQGGTPSQVALAWLAEKRHIVLIGARTIEQLEEDLAALDVQLTVKQRDELDSLTLPRKPYPQQMTGRQERSRAASGAKLPGPAV